MWPGFYAKSTPDAAIIVADRGETVTYRELDDRSNRSAAPCPVSVEERIIEWWGPILYEVYSTTEAIGATTRRRSRSSTSRTRGRRRRR